MVHKKHISCSVLWKMESGVKEFYDVGYTDHQDISDDDDTE